jgi:hypothetical protein
MLKWIAMPEISVKPLDVSVGNLTAAIIKQA